MLECSNDLLLFILSSMAHINCIPLNVISTLCTLYFIALGVCVCAWNESRLRPWINQRNVFHRTVCGTIVCIQLQIHINVSRESRSGSRCVRLLPFPVWYRNDYCNFHFWTFNERISLWICLFVTFHLSVGFVEAKKREEGKERVREKEYDSIAFFYRQIMQNDFILDDNSRRQ